MLYHYIISLFFYLSVYCVLLNTQFLRSWIMPPLHLLAFSTLLGAELYQTFFMTKVTFQALPRKVFVNLQMTVFLVYFWGQTLILILVAFTIPPHGVYSLMGSKTSMVIFAVAEGTTLLNLLIYGPRTQKLMIERMDQASRHERIRDTINKYTEIKQRKAWEERKALDRLFSRAHAMSIHLNLVTIIATLCYGWQLSARMKWDTT